MALSTWNIALFCEDDGELGVTGFILRSRLQARVHNCFSGDELMRVVTKQSGVGQAQPLDAVVLVHTGFGEDSREQTATVARRLRKHYPDVPAILYDRGRAGNEMPVHRVVRGQGGGLGLLETIRDIGALAPA